MTPTEPTRLPVALESLRRPIETFDPQSPGDRRLKIAMIGLADQLQDLWSQDEDETLDSDVVLTALHAFPALTIPGPEPHELVELAVGGALMDAETADTLRTLRRIRRALRVFEPPGFASALCREVLYSIYRLIELFVLIDDDRNTDHCFELLDWAEVIADRFSGAA